MPDYKFNETVWQKLNEPANRLQLALELGLTEQSIIYHIKKRSDHLTKKKALEIIKSITGFSEDDLFALEMTNDEKSITNN